MAVRFGKAPAIAAVCALPLLGQAVLASAPGGTLAWLVTLWSGLAHAALHGGLLLLFALSLRGGREDLVTGLARRVEGSLSPDMARYTRAVTRAWCLFFAAQLLGSAALLALAPREVWSLFVNVLDLPLVVLMFLAEYGVRRLRFRAHAHVSLSAGLVAFARRP